MPNHGPVAEQARMEESRMRRVRWNRWGPFLSERAWGTVREDYSATATPGITSLSITPPAALTAGTKTDWPASRIATSASASPLALWNGHDPILKERLFGLTGEEGNHGEDVKECYFYLDNTPTHSYMKYLYKYPQAAFPYKQLREENRRRTRDDPEYELIDTGVFDESRYFDVLGGVRQGRARRHPDPHHGHESRAGGGRSSICCLRSGSAIDGVGGGR